MHGNETKQLDLWERTHRWPGHSAPMIAVMRRQFGQRNFWWPLWSWPELGKLCCR